MGPPEARPGGNGRAFRFDMDRRRLILGLLWLPAYAFILPLLLTAFQSAYPPLSDSWANFLIEALSAVYLLAVFLPFLRAEFDGLLDHKGRALYAVIGGLLLYFALGYAVTFLSGAMIPGADAIFAKWDAEAAALDRGPAIAAFVFLAPLTQGLLFRGCIFGPLRKKRRAPAYLLAVVVFVIAQVWGSAPGGTGAELLLDMIETLPAAIVLCWSYETGQSLWASVFLQMIITAINF